MTPQHTEGPWKLHHTHTITTAAADMDGCVLEICTMAHCEGPDWPGYDPSNAKLIIAAPDLLAALKQIAAKEYSLNDGTRCEIARIAGTAIAKATE